MTNKTPPRLQAVRAANAQPSSTTAHLIVGDDNRALCGALKGDPARGAITCKACLSRYQHTSPEGRKVARRAAEQAVYEHLAHKVRTKWEYLADALEPPT